MARYWVQGRIVQYGIVNVEADSEKEATRAWREFMETGDVPGKMLMGMVQGQHADKVQIEKMGDES